MTKRSRSNKQVTGTRRKTTAVEESLPVYSLGNLIVSVWRIGKRAARDAAPESVQLAYSRSKEELEDLGFRIEALEGELYNENMRVKVIDSMGGSDKLRIVQCLSPAIYFKDQLIKPAEVVLEGENNDETNC